MSEPLPSVPRAERWDVPFDPRMTEETVERLLGAAPFRDMDEARFPERIPLRGILQFDTALRRLRRGEVVVRRGDYGTSAFLILSGSVRVILESGAFSDLLLGRRAGRKKGPLERVARWWSAWREPESFRRDTMREREILRARVEGGGDVRVFLPDVGRVLDEQRTVALGEGELFGEFAALTRAPRTATLFVDSDDAELLEIRWQGLRELRRFDAAFQQHLDRIFRDRALAGYLAEFPLFRGLAPEARAEVGARAEFATHGKFEWTRDYRNRVRAGGGSDEVVIAQEGDYPNGMVIVRSGFARLVRRFGEGARTLSYLGAGGMYGLRELAHNWRHPDRPTSLRHSLRAVGYAHLIVIPTPVLEQWVFPSLPPGALPPPYGAEEMGLPPGEGATADVPGESMMEFVSEHRFFNGTKTMLIDLDRCTRCDDCVRACASTHDNNPRFLRHGPIHERVMVANACMHCADPVCMIGCPTGAIHRHEAGGQVVIEPATCIGCETCANNCPYDAIRMVEVRGKDGVPISAEDGRPVLKATKCDLCIDEPSGPACARACPHDALVRMNMNDFSRFRRWLHR